MGVQKGLKYADVTLEQPLIAMVEIINILTTTKLIPVLEYFIPLFVKVIWRIGSNHDQN